MATNYKPINDQNYSLEENRKLIVGFLGIEFFNDLDSNPNGADYEFINQRIVSILDHMDKSTDELENQTFQSPVKEISDYYNYRAIY